MTLIIIGPVPVRCKNKKLRDIFVESKSESLQFRLDFIKYQNKRRMRPTSSLERSGSFGALNEVYILGVIRRIFNTARRS